MGENNSNIKIAARHTQQVIFPHIPKCHLEATMYVKRKEMKSGRETPKNKRQKGKEEMTDRQTD